jgi:hypothetical protein
MPWIERRVAAIQTVSSLATNSNLLADRRRAGMPTE